MNRSHLITGEIAIILPCLGRSEIDRQAGGDQFVTVEDSMGVISPSRGHLEPASEHLISEPMIVARMARATLGKDTTVDWEGLAADYDGIRDHISHVIAGFETSTPASSATSSTCPTRRGTNGSSTTATARRFFTVSPIERHDLLSDQFMMMTIRSHDQFNTTVYG